MLVESNSNSIRNKIRTLTSDSVFRNGLFKRLLWTKTRLNAQYVPTLVFVNNDIMLLSRANDERKELTFSADDCKALKTMFMYSPASPKPLPVPINSFAYWIDPQTKRQRRPANRHHVNSTGVFTRSILFVRKAQVSLSNAAMYSTIYSQLLALSWKVHTIHELWA